MTSDELTAYIDNRDNYGSIDYHVPGWGIPFVTGHKYKFHFGLMGVNFEKMDIMIPQHY